MSDGANVIYRYDGSFTGLMTAVYKAISSKKMPENILSESECQTIFFKEEQVVSDEEIAGKMQKYIAEKISFMSLDSIRRCYFSNAENKEMLILKYILLGMKYGRKVETMLSVETVITMFKAVKRFSNEANFYREFLRFTENEGVLSSVIEPENFVLPYIVYHYEQRIGNLDFLIYDKTHKVALIHKDRHSDIIMVDDFSLPEPDDKERFYRELWKGYYNIIGIKERYNEKLRMNLMPKKYWKHMTEFEDMFGENKQNKKCLTG